MFKKILLAFIAVFITALFFIGRTEVSGKNTIKAPLYKQGAVLVRYKNPALASAAWVSATESRLAMGTKKIFPVLGVKELKLPAGMEVGDAVSALRQDPDVEFAEPDYAARIETGPAGSAVPNDPLYANQWAMPAINAPSAWSYVQGSTGVIIAVLDTGVDYTHQDITANIWNNPAPSTPVMAGSASITGDMHGWDFVNAQGLPLDDNGHGTHVAGIAGAYGNDDLGITGVNWRTGIMSVKVLNAAGIGYLDTILQGIEYASARGAKIINASFAFGAGTPFPSSLQTAISDNPDILFIFAAGNNSADIDYYNYPVLPNLLFVASVGQSGSLSTFSNYGPSVVGLASPGEQILSLKAGQQTVYSDAFSTLDWADPTGSWTVYNNKLSDVPPGSSNSWAQSPSIDLTGKQACLANFALDLTASGSDMLDAEASKDGSNWTTLGQFGGDIPNPSDTGWEFVSLDQFTGAPVYFRFRFQTSTAGESAGVYNFEVECSAPGTEYWYESGTSMSAPYVAGAAALIKSAFPTIKMTDVKTLLLAGVDQNPSLNGMVSSGGSLDLYKSLLPPAPANFEAGSISSTSVTLTWDPVPNATGYVLSRAPEGNSPQEIADLSGTAYTDSGLTQSTTYSYILSARNQIGSSPGQSDLTVTTGSPSSSGGGGHGCFIATAAFGSPMAKEVRLLENFRDRHLITNWVGRQFVSLYYHYSPPAAGFIARHERLRTVTRWILYPIVYSARYPVIILAVFVLALAYVAIKIVKYTLCRTTAKKVSLSWKFW